MIMDILKIIAVLCVLTGHVLTRPQTQERCSSPADIIFILDSSASIWHPHFTQQTKFVSNVINSFDIGPMDSQTRVGVLTFGHEVWKQFDLNQIMDKKTMRDTVERIEHGGGQRTNTGDAIKFAVTRMFTPYAGNRPGVSRIAIVITDGRSQDHIETAIAAQKAHDSGVTMFAIGVGTRLDYDELKGIASDPFSDYMFLVEDYNALSRITNKLIKQTCDATQKPEPTTTPTMTTTKPTMTTTTTPKTTTTTTSITSTTIENKPADQSQKDCGGKPADVFFVVDSSGSITRKDFNTEIEFVKNVIKIFDIGKDKTRVGVISFSHNADMVLGLDNQLSRDQLLERVNKIKHVGGGTNSAEALNLLRRSGFSTNITRPNVPKIAVFLTDGLSADEDRTSREAKLTHHAGIKVFAIGIGHGVDLIEIKRIASIPDDDFVFQVNDFNSLDGIKEVLAIKTCGVKPDVIKDEPATKPACDVEQNTDLMFIYDIAALGEEKSQAIAMFLTTIVSQFNLLSGNLHVGRITDNCPSGGNFELSSKITSSDFSAIRLSTFSHLIKKVSRSGFTSEYGGRDDSNKVGVILIDGDMDSLDMDAFHQAKELSKKAEVFVIAMGHNHIIHKFSKSFVGNNFIHLNSYRDLDSAAMELLGKLCYHFQPKPLGDLTPQ